MADRPQIPSLFNPSTAAEQTEFNRRVRKILEAHDLAGASEPITTTVQNAQTAASNAQPPQAQFQEQQAAGVAGGAFNNGAWRTRALNVPVIVEVSGAQLAANQMSLPSGVYVVEARAAGYSCGSHKARLRDITNGLDLLIGTAEASAVGSATSWSIINGRFSLASLTLVELQHQCSATRAGDGFGPAAGFAVIEVYSEVRLWKIG
jgi:hypothetical protein